MRGEKSQSHWRNNLLFENPRYQLSLEKEHAPFNENYSNLGSLLNDTDTHISSLEIQSKLKKETATNYKAFHHGNACYSGTIRTELKSPLASPPFVYVPEESLICHMLMILE